MSTFVLFPLLAAMGLITLVAAFAMAGKASMESLFQKHMPPPCPPPAPCPPCPEPTTVESIQPTLTLIPTEQWDLDVEVIHVPTNNSDWAESIQKQLDAIENRSPENELVSSTSVGGRLILFYKRRVK